MNANRKADQEDLKDGRNGECQPSQDEHKSKGNGRKISNLAKRK